MSDIPVFEAKNLVKRYGHVVALDGVDFELRSGEILAVIGDNGAGKSSLIKALCGAVIPDSGEIRLANEIVHFRITAHGAFAPRLVLSPAPILFRGPRPRRTRRCA